jgi:hypothetical protein
MNKQQLEIRFEDAGRISIPLARNPTPVRPQRQGHSRRNRARWWFNRMRRVVNQAWDWNPAPPARPEQIYLAIAPGR